MDRALRPGRPRHARAARREGRERRRDDARAGRRIACRPGSRSRPRRASGTCERDRRLPDGLEDEVAAALAALEERAGKRLGDADDPLLVSVRSGARESMPGMMDTVLNLGLNDESVEGLAARTDNPRFAWDAYRRFVQMFANVCRGIPGEALEAAIAARKRVGRRRADDVELGEDDLRGLVDDFKAIFTERTGEAFPQDPAEQLRQAIRAVFDSWLGKRAATYRRINHIPDDWGTACNVQQMVFGNKGDTSCSGVAFCRDEVTGAPEPSGDFLVNAQGEDVVSGVRTPRDLAADGRRDAGRARRAAADPAHARGALPRHAGHGVHRRGGAPVHAADAQREAAGAGRGALRGRRGRRGAARRAARRWPRSTRRALDALLHPTFDPHARRSTCSPRASPPRRARPRARSCSRRTTRSTGRSAAAPWCSSARSPRPTTCTASSPRRGSSPPRAARPRTPRSSRAGWASRASPAPSALRIDLEARELRVGDTTLREGDLIAIDGSTGRVTADDVPLSERRGRPQPRHASWAGRTRSAGSACAPTPTRPRTRARRASSAPRGSACAGPSTCSWPPTASRRCRR